MRWPWRNKLPQDAPDLEAACAELQRVVQQRDEVERLRLHLRRHRQMNGFADLVFRPASGRRQR